MRVLIADPIHPEGIKILKRAGMEVVNYSGENFDEIIRDSEALIVRASGLKVDKNLLVKAPRLKVVGLASTGHDSIDLEAAALSGVVVLGQPNSKNINAANHGNFISVAEHTIGLMIALSKNIITADNAMKEGSFPKKELGPKGQELFRKTLGLIGFGRIGKLVARRAKSFGMNILAYDPYLTLQEKGEVVKIGAKLVSLDSLLRSSDYVSVHVPKTEETKGMISGPELKKMKKGSVIINCARGGIIDESFLLEALTNGKLRGAGLDVFSEEPPQNEILARLIKHPRVIATPHIAGPTQESLKRFSRDIAKGIVKFLKEGILVNPLNARALPEKRYREIENYRKLAKILGTALFQLTGSGDLKKIFIRYRGRALNKEDAGVVTGSCVREILKCLENVKDKVNYVNALLIAEKLEIVVKEEFLEALAGEYGFLCEIEINRSNGVSRKIAGTILGKRGLRIIEVDDYVLEARPSERMIIIENQDQPGVIGKIGTILGRNSINIAHFHLGRAEGTDRALAVISVDTDVPQALLEELSQLENIRKVSFIALAPEVL